MHARKKFEKKGKVKENEKKQKEKGKKGTRDKKEKVTIAPRREGNKKSGRVQ